MRCDLSGPETRPCLSSLFTAGKRFKPAYFTVLLHQTMTGSFMTSSNFDKTPSWSQTCAEASVDLMWQHRFSAQCCLSLWFCWQIRPAVRPLKCKTVQLFRLIHRPYRLPGCVSALSSDWQAEYKSLTWTYPKSFMNCRVTVAWQRCSTQLTSAASLGSRCFEISDIKHTLQNLFSGLGLRIWWTNVSGLG